MQPVAVGEALDRGDLGALPGDRENQAAVHPAAVQQDRARPALAVVAPLLGAGTVR